MTGPEPARETPEQKKESLKRISDDAQVDLSRTHGVREQALRLTREVVRNSANSIRATHRGEFARARELFQTANETRQDMETILEGHPDVYHAGYVEDSLKEYVEAGATLAFVEDSHLPTPDELGVGYAVYLNGLAESVGELRRFVLDSLRRDDFSRCEALLEIMDEVYTVLVSVDFPDAVTRGLRRNTDMVRGVLERTRGDLTVALRQRRLEEKMAALSDSLPRAVPVDREQADT